MKIGSRVKGQYGIGTIKQEHNTWYVLYDCGISIGKKASGALEIVGIAPEFMEHGDIVSYNLETKIVDEVKILATKVIVTWESGISSTMERYGFTLPTLGKRP